MTSKKQRLRVIPLGGLGEIGKNMTVFEYGNDIIVVDTGIMFPDDDHPGIDLIIPDFGYLVKRREKVRGIVITHGHEDHTGALPYLLKEIGHNIPVLGTKLTLGLVAIKLEEHRIKKPKLREVRSGGHSSLGVFGIDFIPVNHSIPDGVALLIRTPVGNVLHTGDFKFDQTPIDNRHTDYSALAAAGKKGVMLLMSDSTNAESPGITRSESVVGGALREIFSTAEQRIIVASFASHIHRLQQVCDAAVEAGRKVVVTGRSMVNNTKIARQLGYLDVDEDDIIDAYEMGSIPADKLVVLSTGSQGEPLSALARMASSDHKTVSIGPLDTVVISATPVPGNEKAVSRVINRLTQSGANVVHKGLADVHVSGHAASEELKLMLNLIRPTYFIPIHGESRHLRAHAELALSTGVPEQNIFIIGNGDCVEFDTSGARQGDHVESGVVYVDGLSVGDVGQTVLRDRQMLAHDGIVAIFVVISADGGAVLGTPQVVLRGVAVPSDEAALVQEARARVVKTCARHQGVSTAIEIEAAIRESLAALIWERARSRPMFVPVVVEV